MQNVTNVTNVTNAIATEITHDYYLENYDIVRNIPGVPSRITSMPNPKINWKDPTKLLELATVENYIITSEFLHDQNSDDYVEKWKNHIIAIMMKFSYMKCDIFRNIKMHDVIKYFGPTIARYYLLQFPDTLTDDRIIYGIKLRICTTSDISLVQHNLKYLMFDNIRMFNTVKVGEYDHIYSFLNSNYIIGDCIDIESSQICSVGHPFLRLIKSMKTDNDVVNGDILNEVYNNIPKCLTKYKKQIYKFYMSIIDKSGSIKVKSKLVIDEVFLTVRFNDYIRRGKQLPDDWNKIVSIPRFRNYSKLHDIVIIWLL